MRKTGFVPSAFGRPARFWPALARAFFQVKLFKAAAPIDSFLAPHNSKAHLPEKRHGGDADVGKQPVDFSPSCR